MSNQIMDYPIQFVAFDLETTGLNPNEHQIIEIGAVKVINGKIVDEFDRLIDPQTDIPFHITQLTGISKEDVKGAQLIQEVLPEFYEFIGDMPLVAHNAPFDIKFLQIALARYLKIQEIKNPVFDTFELSRIILPRIRQHRLLLLLQYFKIDIEEAHRAFDDAEGAAYLLLYLIKEAMKFDKTILEAFFQILQNSDWSYLSFFNELQVNAIKYILTLATGKSANDESLLVNLAPVKGSNSKKKPGERIQVTPENALSHLRRLSSTMDSYEKRIEQEEMLIEVANAFTSNKFLVVEAGTGTGKSLAYLVPSILNSVQNGERVVISTNTKNLQEQLFFQDIPLLQNKLGLDFKAVLLKGRSNYLCLRRWDEVMANPELEFAPPDRIDLLPLVVWVKQTQSGDIAECTGFRVDNRWQIWNRLSADQNNCSAQECAHFKKGTCYLYKVRNETENAQIVVINHSLLFSDLQTENSILNSYDRLVIDEAHNFERVATDYLGRGLTYWEFRALIHRLHFQVNSVDLGLITKLRRFIASATGDLNWKNDVNDSLDEIKNQIQNYDEQVKNYFRYFTGYVQGIDNAKKYDGSIKIRIKNNHDIIKEFSSINADLKIQTDELKATLNKIKLQFEKNNNNYDEKFESMLSEIRGSLVDFQTISESLDFFTHLDENQYVYWIEGPRKSDSIDTRWRSAPLNISETLEKNLYQDKKTIIFTSATITVGKSFEFFKARTGLNLVKNDKVVVKEIGSPFDYDNQTLIVVPVFLPDPKSQQYTDNFANLLKNLSFLTKRGTLVLFTSYGMLNKTYSMVKSDFEERKILLLGQGQDGSRTNILNRFKEDTQSVLFGTDSFWEGVDIPGAALEVLLITRLPFLVPDEPLVEAHQENLAKKGINPFENYMLPMAVLKFRQGIGRLIRRKDDFGLVVITDTRLVKTKFGSVFNQSLPTKLHVINSEKELLSQVKSWFENKR